MSTPFGGISPEYLDQLKMLMGQMAPSDSDKKSALSHSLMSAGFGILANAANNPWVAIGKGASGGLLAYNDELKQSQAQRAQNLAAASQVQNFAQKSRMDSIVNSAMQSMLPGQQTTGQTVPPSNGANVVTTPLTSTGQPGQPIPQDQGPPQGVPQAQGGPPPMSRDAMAKLGTIMALAKGGDITAANNFMFPKPESMRKDAGYLDPATNIFHPGGSAPPGYTYNPQTQKLEKMQGADDAFSQAEARAKAVELSYKPPQEAVNPATGAKEIPPGTALGQMFGNQALPYGAPAPYGPQGTVDPAVAAFAAKSGAGPRDFVSGLGRNGQPATLPMDGGAAPTQSGAGRVTELGPTFNAEQTATGKYLSDQAQKVDEQSQYAQLMKGRIAELKSLSQNFTPGALTPMKEKLGSMLQGLGMDPDTVASKLGSVGDMQAFNKLAIQMAFDATKQLTNRPAASEVMLQLKANPSLALSPKGTDLILGYMDGLADWQLQKQAAKDDWIKQNGTYRGFEGQWAKSEPLTKYVPSVSKMDTQSSTPPMSAIEAEMRRRGLLK